LLPSQLLGEPDFHRLWRIRRHLLPDTGQQQVRGAVCSRLCFSDCPFDERTGGVSMLTRSDEDDEGSEDESHEQDNAEGLLHEGFLSRRGGQLNPAPRTTAWTGDRGMVSAGVGVQGAGHGSDDDVDDLVGAVGQEVHAHPANGGTQDVVGIGLASARLSGTRRDVRLLQ
jgi:hypothetical protein